MSVFIYVFIDPQFRKFDLIAKANEQKFWLQANKMESPTNNTRLESREREKMGKKERHESNWMKSHSETTSALISYNRVCSLHCIVALWISLFSLSGSQKKTHKKRTPTKTEE